MALLPLYISGIFLGRPLLFHVAPAKSRLVGTVLWRVGPVRGHVLWHARAAERVGLNVTAIQALGFIVEAQAGIEAFSPRALAGVLDVSTASMTVITDRLEDAGLVER